MELQAVKVEQALFSNKMRQFNIRNILERNRIIPVVTINSLNEIDEMVQELNERDISCIEVTLRTPLAFKALSLLKRNYNHCLEVGVGTVVNQKQLKMVSDLDVDFIVSPGLMLGMTKELQKIKKPFIPGVHRLNQ